MKISLFNNRVDNFSGNSNNQGASGNIPFGEGLSISQKEIKDLKKILKDPVKKAKLSALEAFLRSNREKWLSVIETVQADVPIGFLPTILLKFKSAKNSDFQILVLNKSEIVKNNSPKAVGDLFQTSGEINQNAYEEVAAAITGKAEEGNFIAKISRQLYDEFASGKKTVSDVDAKKYNELIGE